MNYSKNWRRYTPKATKKKRKSKTTTKTTTEKEHLIDGQQHLKPPIETPPPAGDSEPALESLPCCGGGGVGGWYRQVSALLLVGIIIVGGALGYWLVRKFVISEDGSVDSGIAGFVKWAMRLVAVTLIFQRWKHVAKNNMGRVSKSKMKPGLVFVGLRVAGEKREHGILLPRHDHGVLFTRSIKSRISLLRHSLASPSTTKGKRNQQDFYSTYHKTPDRKKFSKKEWGDFTEESTRQAVANLASSPEFTDWIIEHADRIQIVPEESSGERSASDSTDENVVESGNGLDFSPGFSMEENQRISGKWKVIMASTVAMEEIQPPYIVIIVIVLVLD
ncbi:hypothetical protein RJ640_023396 [Escallonia rubra]|uniref:Uncharacterized protein n=1 Tax=Escallonia rubra TaxID=112253 RepID=A0AA88R3M2_9ASTE|nr:hypothetical protein RJ640_023396 [Escallonia rubra]